MKIALIIDKSQTYIDLQKDIMLAKWELAPADTKKINGFGAAGIATLFGPAPASILHLEDIDQVKKLVVDMTETIKKDKLGKSVGKGLIIYTQVARNSTKKLEKLVTDSNGEVIFSKINSKDTMGPGPRLISDLNFSREVKDYLIDYVGQDYENLVPIVRDFSDYTKSEQRKVTLEEVYIRLPQAQGSVPPWEIEKPLMAGRTSEMISMFRRIDQSSDLLVVLAILKNKMQLAYRVSFLIANDREITQEKISEVLDVTNGYPLKLAIQSAKNIGLVRLQKAVELLAHLETHVKGGGATAGDVTMEVKLIELQSILRGN